MTSRSLLLFVLLTACGRSRLCENMNSVASQFQFLAKSCSNMVTPSVAPATCSAAASSACTSADHQIMERALDCAQAAPACSPGREASFVATVLSCTPTLSAACVAAMSGTRAGPVQKPSEDYCSRSDSTETALRSKAAACPQVKLRFLTEATCRANMDSCSAKDERVLEASLDCELSLAACKKGEDTAWAAKVDACAPKPADLSEDCVRAWK